MINHILTPTNVTFFLDGEPKTIPSTHPSFSDVVNFLRLGQEDLVRQAAKTPETITNFTEGRVTSDGRGIYWNGKPVGSGLADRILKFLHAGDEALARPLCRFLDRLKENPSFRAQHQLFDWLQATGLPIASDGRVIAYKIVKEDFFDIYSGTFDNSVGRIVSVPRYEVDEDPNQTCSYGLHVCSEGYLPHYGTAPGNRVVIVAVDPKDWVAVPTDYNNAKARVCAYEVLAEMPRDQAAQFVSDAGLVYPIEPSVTIEDVVRVFDEEPPFIELTLSDGSLLQIQVENLTGAEMWTLDEWRELCPGEDGLDLVNGNWSMTLDELRVRA